MLTCSSIKKKFYEAKLKGENTLKIDKNKIKQTEIEDLKECGYNVIINKYQIIIKE